VTNEILYRANVIRQFLGEGERLSDQPRHPLSQRAVESLDMIGNALLLFDDSMLLLWNDTFVCLPPVCIKGRMSPVALWY
jgi:hypothetical protein